jgi:hypothetical protein
MTVFVWCVVAFLVNITVYSGSNPKEGSKKKISYEINVCSFNLKRGKVWQ